MGEPDPWASLDAELDAWAAAGRSAAVWWRDDDATAPGPALDRLLKVSGDASAPLALAVIPARVATDFAKGLDGHDLIAVVQHGYAHVNHAPRGQGLGAWELGLHRPEEEIMEELAAGRARLADLFGARFVAALVPPWNRIDERLVPHLPEAGLTGLSTFRPRKLRHPAPRVTQVNAHCDPIKWKGGSRFAGVARSLDDLVGHLRARREGRADPDEPTGLLTHHRDLDEDGWRFVARLTQCLTAHPATLWRAADALFGPVKVT